jgi:hypothetical protein
MEKINEKLVNPSRINAWMGIGHRREGTICKRRQMSMILLIIIAIITLSMQLSCKNLPFIGQPSPGVATLDPNGYGTTVSDLLMYRNEVFGFTFMYPSGAILTETPDKRDVSITFPNNGNTNVIEEQVLVAVRSSLPCINPLAEEMPSVQLSEREIILHGLKFLQQKSGGVALGTAITTEAYLTEQNQQCITFQFILKTFDPANLDPTAFPDPPIAINWQKEVEMFEGIVSTFSVIKR